MATECERLGVSVPRCPMEAHTRWTITLTVGRFMTVERTPNRRVGVRDGDNDLVLFDPDCVSALCEAMTKCVQEIREAAK